MASVLWYLVESDIQGRSTYSVIHSADVIESMIPNPNFINPIQYYRDGVVHLAKVICTSHDRKLIDDELKKLIDLEPKAPVLDQKPRTSYDEQEALLREVEAMEQKMQQETKMISDAFDSVDRVRQGMDRRLEVLNKILFI